jgi:xanthine dehydrogenase accessory factor
VTTTAERIRELTASRKPFVHATVVRAQEPTSARPGDDAVVLADGTMEGFVGGVCAESSVRAAALDSLASESPLLLRVLPSGSLEFPDAPGALVVANPCHSGGALEIFLRPVLPKPLFGVVGQTPIARAIGDLARFLGFEVVSDGDYAGSTAVVVAGLGRDEEAALRAALDAQVGYLALVASRKRGAVVLDGMGLTPDERARVHTPAGIDIGARTPEEIALSILAEVIRARRTEGLAAPASVEAPRQAVDPVCGMTVVVGPDTPHAGDNWFCCQGCLDTFLAAA